MGKPDYKKPCDSKKPQVGKDASHFKENLKAFGIGLASGGIAGALSKTVTAPLERIKVILQVQGMSNVPAEKRYKGILDAAIRIPKEQGFLSFWRGNMANVMRIIPNAAIKFTMYDQYKQLLLPKGEKGYSGAEKIIRKLASGGLSGATTLAITYPMDFARTRLTADTGGKAKYSGLVDCIVKTAKEEGPLALYNGVGFSLVGIIPYLAISFAVNDTLNTLIPKDDEKSQKGKFMKIFSKLGAGSASAIISQSLTFPLDTIRRRLQMDGAGGKKKKYAGALDCTMKMVKEEGFTSLYRGLFANAIRAIPGAAIEFTTFDLIKKYLLKNENLAHQSF